MPQVCTYIHRQVDTGEVFYVGKGTLKCARESSGRNSYWGRVAKKHGWTSEVLAIWPSNEEALEHEKFLIACFRDMGCRLTNLTAGGEGAYGLSPSPETRAKMRAAKLGRKLSPERREKLRASLIGRPVSAETRKKMSDSHRGRKYPERCGPRPRWIVERAAAGKTRPTLGIDGRVQSMTAWAEELGVGYTTVTTRVARGCFPCGTRRGDEQLS